MQRLNTLEAHLSRGRNSGRSDLSLSANAESQLKYILDSDNHQNRQKVWDLARQDPDLFTPVYGETLPAQRDRAYKQLKKICDSNVISVTDFDRNPKNVFTVHECVAVLDTSTATKMTVQFNLFGGTVLRLGTARHHKVIPAIDTLEQVGCFALTEVGYGNNAVEMEAVAVYDKTTDEFIINTPTPLSKKFWITNGAIHAHWCIVFAQLEIDNKGYGVHPFLARIRDDGMRPMRGVKIIDMGYKMGSNGVDNAELVFTDFRAPRESLLDSVSTVDAHGRFTSKEESKRQRFITQTDQLLSGRLCLASMALGVSKACLITTVRYSSTRLSVGATGKSDTPIGAYQLQRQALMPLIADTYVLNALLGRCKEVYAQMYQTDRPKPHNTKLLYLECMLLCCATKPQLGWHGGNTGTVCRERCGGQGYLSHNMLGEWLATSHACMTAEGDNRVLWQKVSKELLTVFGSDMYTAINKLWATSRDRVMLSGEPNLEYFKRLFARREGLRLEEMQAKMMSNATDKQGVFDVWMMQESALVQDIAAAFTERSAVDAIGDQINCPNHYLPEGQQVDASLRSVLDAIAQLYGCQCVERDAVWYVTSGEVTPTELKKIREWRVGKIESLSPIMQALVECFNIPNSCLFAPIAHDWRKLH
eukprot:GHVN01009320.1.p1 GENE.GHVN01009320.1~~GHVN01009320.1.p1  ORF type:complete len:647 (+),score=85.86 GHVN01009320.1:542-2482(+)